MRNDSAATGQMPLLRERLGDRLLSHRGVDTLNILMVGDVVGKPGRKVFKAGLSRLRECARLDFVTLNGENLAGGFGITTKIFDELTSPGLADVVTMGNHWSDKPDVHTIRRASPKLVLPQNLADLEGVDRVPVFEIPGRGKKVAILNLMGQFAMKDTYADPFVFIEKRKEQLKEWVRSGEYILLADIHAEASSEKQAIAWYLDGTLACLVGTHTHTPTSDERISQKGTALLTDVGMTGPYRSVIGMDVEKSLRRYFGPKERKPQEVGDEDAWFCAFLVEISPLTGLALAAHRIQWRESSDDWRFSSCYS
ncbi:MAG: YmdB family metallophosphoesterase [Silvanigrellales bacterium]|nr:YmdB family metallophosphoesterase [Silvanigrellales bacterium]